MSYDDPHQMHDAFITAFETADPDRLVELYEPDAIQLGQDGQVVGGHAGIRPVFEYLLGAGITLQGTQDKALVAGGLALTSSQYQVEVTGDDGQVVTRTVHTAEVSRRQPDGTWRVVIDAPSFS